MCVNNASRARARQSNRATREIKCKMPPPPHCPQKPLCHSHNESRSKESDRERARKIEWERDSACALNLFDSGLYKLTNFMAALIARRNFARYL